jgi:hypothetical protein
MPLAPCIEFIRIDSRTPVPIDYTPPSRVWTVEILTYDIIKASYSPAKISVSTVPLNFGNIG